MVGRCAPSAHPGVQLGWRAALQRFYGSRSISQAKESSKKHPGGASEKSQGLQHLSVPSTTWESRESLLLPGPGGPAYPIPFSLVPRLRL